MIGGCILSGKYNMTGMWYPKTTTTNSNTGQVKASYLNGQEISLIARGLANLRGTGLWQHSQPVPLSKNKNYG
jgi:hypothetical protein